MDKTKYDPSGDPRVRPQDDGSTIVELEYPVERKEGELLEIKLRRPLVSDLEASDRASGDIAKSVMIVASMSGLPVGVIKKLDVGDFMRVQAVVEGYVGGNAQAGEG